MSPLNWLLGSVEENAERELDSGNYKPGRTRKRDLGDIIGETLTGRKSETDEAVKNLYVERLKDKYGTQLTNYKNLPGYGGIETIDANTREQDLKNLVNEYENKYRRHVDALDYGASEGGLTPDEMEGKTRQQIYSMVTNKRKDEETEKDNKQYRRELEYRKDLLQSKMDDRQADRELKLFELKQQGSNRKADLFKALFGLGSAFMI